MVRPSWETSQPRAGVPSLLLGLVMVGATSCGSPEPHHTAARPPTGPPKTIETVEVTRATADQERTVPATVQARQRAALSARIPASVAEMPFREGQRVAKGAMLVRLDDTALRSAVAAGVAGVNAAEADLKRMKALLEKDAATPREVDQAEAHAAAARAALRGAEDNLSYAVLKAPFTGTVAARPVNVGDVVSPGTTLIEIEGGGGLEVKATVESGLVSVLQPGLELEAWVDGQELPLTARLRTVSPAGDPTTHRFEVKADLPRATGLRSGLFARLVLRTPSEAAVITVPESAVFTRGGLTGVYVVAEGKARLRWIAVGAVTQGRMEIRAGLKAGERVARDPSGLVDGAPVEESR